MRKAIISLFSMFFLKKISVLCGPYTNSWRHLNADRKGIVVNNRKSIESERRKDVENDLSSETDDEDEADHASW